MAINGEATEGQDQLSNGQLSIIKIGDILIWCLSLAFRSLFLRALTAMSLCDLILPPRTSSLSFPYSNNLRVHVLFPFRHPTLRISELNRKMVQKLKLVQPGAYIANFTKAHHEYSLCFLPILFAYDFSSKDKLSTRKDLFQSAALRFKPLKYLSFLSRFLSHTSITERRK